MTRDSFLQAHTKIRELIVNTISNPNTSANDKNALPYILSALDDITYGNRLSMKGMLSHMVVDTNDFNNNIGEEIILFDKRIS